MYFPPETAKQFIAVSAALTGFDEVELVATGVGESLWDTLVGVVGSPIAGDFLSACALAFARSTTAEQLHVDLKACVLEHHKLGPLARNVITMWYLGQWNPLPREWCDAYGNSPLDVCHIISSQAYIQSLVWPAFGAHPQGAKPTGFGSWAEPPLRRINTDYPKM